MADLDLARRAVASPRWRLRLGMLTLCGRRVVPANMGGFALVRAAFDSRDGLARGQHDIGGPVDWTELLPDLDDPATLGAVEHGLLAPAGVWVERTHSEWRATTLDGRWLGPWRDTLAAALVDGLESAP